MTTVNVFRNIEGYPDYGIARNGDIVSFMLSKAGRVMKHNINAKSRVSVRLTKDGVSKSMLVYRLLYAAFIGPIDKGMQIRHLDDNPLNNELSNLSQGDNSDNQVDRSNNCMNQGETSASQLTTEDAEYIKYSGLCSQDLADIFGVHRTTVSNIKAGRTWGHI